jgi:hypothetical protein
MAWMLAHRAIRLRGSSSWPSMPVRCVVAILSEIRGAFAVLARLPACVILTHY